MIKCDPLDISVSPGLGSRGPRWPQWSPCRLEDSVLQAVGWDQLQEMATCKPLIAQK